jgi:hypothetical protein
MGPRRCMGEEGSSSVDLTVFVREIIFLRLRLGLKEVVWGTLCDMRLPSSGRRIELQKVVVELLVDLHHTCLIPAAVAVVWRGENGDHVLIMSPLVPVHDQLVRP